MEKSLRLLSASLVGGIAKIKEKLGVDRPFEACARVRQSARENIIVTGPT